MKRLASVILLILCTILLSSCAKSNLIDATLRSPKKMAYDEDHYKTNEYLQLINGLSRFSYNFSSAYIKNAGITENIAVSPLSVYMALSLASECSSGNTRSEILNALGVTQETLQSNIAYLYNMCNKIFEVTEPMTGVNKEIGRITLSNSLWFDENITLKDKTLDILASKYQCYSYKTAFLKHNKEANSLIREFVKEKTNDLIDQEFNLDKSTAFALINTLYLKDIWTRYVEELSFSTKTYDFKNSDGSISSKNLLVGYYKSGLAREEDKYSVFHTFTENGISITFILPKDGYNLIDIYTKETLEEVRGMIYKTQDDTLMEKYFTRCIFPEFEASSNSDIKAILKSSFGISDLFTDRCDYSSVTDTACYCDKVIHVAKLNVDKKGIEGAAVTVLSNATSAGPEEYEIVYRDFVIDRAFGYLVEYGGIPLFTGTINHIE